MPFKEVAFHNAHRHVNIERKLKHWDVIDTLEGTCQYETFTWVWITGILGVTKMFVIYVGTNKKNLNFIFDSLDRQLITILINVCWLIIDPKLYLKDPFPLFLELPGIGLTIISVCKNQYILQPIYKNFLDLPV